MKKTDFFCASESLLIGCLLSDITLLDEVMEIVKPEDFLRFNLQRYFSTMIEMSKQQGLLVDIYTLSDRLKNEVDKEHEIMAELAEMQYQANAPENAKHYAKVVKDESNKRKIFFMLDDAKKRVFEQGMEVLEYLSQSISDIHNNHPVELKSYASDFQATLEEIDMQAQRTTSLVGVSTGFKELDEITNGFQAGELIVIAGRPSMGKTLFAGNIADNIGLKQGLPAVFFSLEMKTSLLMKRTLSRFANVEAEKIFSANLSNDDWTKIVQIQPYITGSRLFINDQCRLSVNDMRGFARKIRSMHGLSAIFIDYLGLMKSENAENETIRLGLITAELKALAKDLNVPVVLICQLNRGVEGRPDKRPNMADIRQSGAIEQDADLIFLLYRDDYYHPESPAKGMAEIIVAKNRNGKTGTINLEFNPEFLEFKSRSTLK